MRTRFGHYARVVTGHRIANESIDDDRLYKHMYVHVPAVTAVCGSSCIRTMRLIMISSAGPRRVSFDLLT
jgi:hypothetical protein